MSEHRFYGGELDPRADPDRWEGAVRSIVSAARPGLERLAGRRTALSMLAQWQRPVFAVAASIILLAGVALVTQRGEAQADEVEVPVVAEAIASPEVAAWLVAGHTPTVEELLLSLGGETR